VSAALILAIICVLLSRETMRIDLGTMKTTPASA
jgi:hypothetical protein